jgi:rubredoxin
MQVNCTVCDWSGDDEDLAEGDACPECGAEVEFERIY